MPGSKAPLQIVVVFCPAGSNNSLVSASPRIPWAPCCACQGHCKFPAVNAAVPGWQMFLHLFEHRSLVSAFPHCNQAVFRAAVPARCQWCSLGPSSKKLSWVWQ